MVNIPRWRNWNKGNILLHLRSMLNISLIIGGIYIYHVYLSCWPIFSSLCAWQCSYYAYFFTYFTGISKLWQHCLVQNPKPNPRLNIINWTKLHSIDWNRKIKYLKSRNSIHSYKEYPKATTNVHSSPSTFTLPTSSLLLKLLFPTWCASHHQLILQTFFTRSSKCQDIYSSR